jgi:hypothetical protein
MMGFREDGHIPLDFSGVVAHTTCMDTTTDQITVRGTPCAMCGKPINSRGWLRCYPYSTECGKDCFITAALSEPLISSDGVFLHAAYLPAVRERDRLAIERAARLAS